MPAAAAATIAFFAVKTETQERESDDRDGGSIERIASQDINHLVYLFDLR